MLQLLNESEIAATELSSLRDVCKHINRENLEELRKFLDSRFEKTWVNLPTWLQSDKAIFKKKWFTTNCIEEMQEYAMSLDTQQFQPLFTFDPVVKLNEIPDHSKRERAALAYNKVRVKHVPIIKQNVESAYEREKMPTGNWMTKKTEQTMWEEWMILRYPEIVEAVVTAETTNPNTKQKKNETSTTDVTEISTPTQMFCTPKKKRRIDAAKGTEDEVESCFRSVADLHMGAIANTVSLECYLLYCREEPRSVTINRARRREETSVLTMLGADCTGPIKIDLWGKLADDNALSISEMQEAADEKLVLLELKHFRLAEIKEAHHTVMRKLHSTPRSTIRQITTPTQKFLDKETATMSNDLFSRQFSCLVATPPFDVSITGIVTDLEEPIRTESSELLRKYTLVDRSGKYIFCAAFGRHAQNEILANNNEIVIYFAKAQEGRGNTPSTLWLYDESHIILLRAGRETPQKKEKIEFILKKA